jgi:type I restriction enzyme S subunit
MTAGLQPYRAYRDSGMSWLGEVPAHWDVVPGRAIYREKKESNVGMKERTVLSLSYGQIVVKPDEKLHGLVPASFETYQIVEPGEIVVRPTDLQNDWNSLRFGLSRHRGIITSAYMCLNAMQPISQEYGYLLLHAYDLIKVFYGLGSGLRQNLDWRDFKYLPCVVPPSDEQAAIVRYLDHVDRRVRRYIAAKRKLIALLNEEKQAIIHRAVTRGLDPSVRLKPSGVEWLGDVPEHWEVRRNGRLFVERNETGFSELPILVVSLRTGIRIRSFENPARKQTLSDRDMYKRALTGNIVYNMMRMWQGAVGVVPCDGLISPAYVVAQPLSGTHAQYYSNLFRTDAYMGAVDMYSHGIVKDRNRLYWEAFKQLPSPHPPLHEQAAITLAISNETNDLDIAIGRLWNEIALMREYRARLIADVVTGKVDVRAVAAGLPAEDFEVDHFMPVEEISDEAAVELQSDEEVV